MRKIPSNIPKVIKNKEADKSSQLSLNAQDLHGVTRHTSALIDGVDDIFTLNPDIKLGMEGVISDILSPNNGTTSELTYSLVDERISSAACQTLCKNVGDYMEKEYSLNSKLSKILEEAYFTKGGYYELILPNNALQQIALEEFSGHKITADTVEKASGINMELLQTSETSLKTGDIKESTYVNSKGKKIKVDLSSNSELITVANNELDTMFTDNPLVLRTGIYAEHKAGLETSKKIKKSLFGNSSNMFTNMLDVSEQTNKEKARTGKNSVASIIALTDKRNSIFKNNGKPLVIKIPADALAPIYENGNPSNTIGWFGVIDTATGAFVNNTTTKADKDTNASKYISNNQSTQMIKKANEALNGKLKKDPTLGNVEQLFSQLMDVKIKNILNKSKFNEVANVDDSDIKRNIFNRMLKGKGTKIVFLPKELVSSYVFNHRDNGTGKSILETISVLISLRSIVFMTKFSGYIETLRPNKRFNVKLDPDEKNPVRASKIALAKIIENNQNKVPWGHTDINYISEWLETSNISVTYDHEALPNISYEKEIEQNNLVIPDSDIEDKITELIYARIGATKNQITETQNDELAISVAARHRLISKRSAVIQKTFTPMISDNVYKLAINDENFITKQAELLLEDKAFRKNILKPYGGKKPNADAALSLAKDYIEHTLQYIVAGLPEPKVENNQELAQQYADYMDNVTEYVEYTYPNESLPKTLIEEFDTGEKVRVIILAMLSENWCLTNNHLPDTLDILNVSDSKTGLNEALNDLHYNKLLKTSAIFKKFITNIEKNAIKDGKFTEKLEEIITKDDKEEEEVNDNDNDKDENEEGEGKEEGEIKTPEEQNNENDF